MPKIKYENYKLVLLIEKNKSLPKLPPEIWILIFEIRDKIIEYENSIPFDVKWNMGWRPRNYMYKTANWITESKQNYWSNMTKLGKIFWKLGIYKVDKLEYWDENPSWNEIFFSNINFENLNT